MRPFVFALLVALVSALVAAADEKDDKLKAAANEAALDFRAALAEKKLDDALKLVGTPLTYGTVAKYKAYPKAEDAKAQLKPIAAAGGFGPGDFTGALTLKELGEHKFYKALKNPASAILGKNQGFVAVHQTENGGRVVVIVVAIKDGKPQVVGLLVP